MDPLLLTIATTVFVGGAAWGGARAALSGTRERVAKLEDSLEAHTAHENMQQLQILQRLTALETKVDILIKKD